MPWRRWERDPDKGLIYNIWNRYYGTIGYLMFVTTLIVSLFILRHDFETQTKAQRVASCERGNIIRESVNQNKEAMRAILIYNKVDVSDPFYTELFLPLPVLNCSDA